MVCVEHCSPGLQVTGPRSASCSFRVQRCKNWSNDHDREHFVCTKTRRLIHEHRHLPWYRTCYHTDDINFANIMWCWKSNYCEYFLYINIHSDCVVDLNVRPTPFLAYDHLTLTYGIPNHDHRPRILVNYWFLRVFQVNYTITMDVLIVILTLIVLRTTRRLTDRLDTLKFSALILYSMPCTAHGHRLGC